MGQNKDFYIPLPERIITPPELEGRLPEPAHNILAAYYGDLLEISQKSYYHKTPFKMEFAHNTRTSSGVPELYRHPTLALFETPYLVTTGILNGDIKARPTLGDSEPYYRELVGLSLVKVLEIVDSAYSGTPQWSPTQMRHLNNGRECYEVSTVNHSELATVNYVPSRRELVINWYDQNPRVPVVGEPTRFSSLHAEIRANSEIFDDNAPRMPDITMDFVVSALEWAKQPNGISRVVGRRRLTDDLLGESKHHVKIATGPSAEGLTMMSAFLRLLRVAYLRPAERNTDN